MTVLTLGGKPINWNRPPKATARVKWSQLTTGGKPVTGSFRSICHLDRLNSQFDDFYSHKNALALLESVPSWFPPSISATIFDLDVYVARQRDKQWGSAL